MKVYINQILKCQGEIDCHYFKFLCKGKNSIKCVSIYFDEVKQNINKSDLFKARCTCKVVCFAFSLRSHVHVDWRA